MTSKPRSQVESKISSFYLVLGVMPRRDRSSWTILEAIFLGSGAVREDSLECLNNFLQPVEKQNEPGQTSEGAIFFDQSLCSESPREHPAPGEAGHRVQSNANRLFKF
jgi:hypothetical protein